MKSDKNAQDVNFWIQEIEKRGQDSVASILVSKLGTPEAAAIQMAIVEYHRKNGNSQSSAALPAEVGSESNSDTNTTESRAPFVIACVALCIAILALTLTVISNYT